MRPEIHISWFNTKVMQCAYSANPLKGWEGKNGEAEEMGVIYAKILSPS